MPMKKTLRMLIVFILIICMAGCGSQSSDILNTILPTDSGLRSTPRYTLSPLVTPQPEKTSDPTLPTPTPTHNNDGYYIYTLHHGDAKYPYAWTDECPINGEIKYGVTGSAEVRALQARLTQLGFYCGGTTGNFNALTLTALNEFQAVVKLDKTSYLDRQTIDVLFSPDGIEAMQINEYDIPEGTLEGITVFLDAGHGGTDTGTARGSLVERTFVIETTYRVKEMLEKAGARVIMTRKDDTIVSLAYRSALPNDIMISDLCDEVDAQLQEIRRKTDILASLGHMSASEIKQKAENIIKSKNDMIAEIAKASEYAEKMKDEYGNGSPEYIEAKKSLKEHEIKSKELKEKYDFVMKAYYSVQMGISTDLYIEQYDVKADELTQYKNKLLHYREQLKITLNDPYTADTGLWIKQYDNDDLKIINPDLKEILDLTGEKCGDKYIFVSVHVNGVDNADHVNGTEIYVRNNNSTANAYGVNKKYYLNYNTAARKKFASCLKTALDDVIPLENDKGSVIKDSDLWVLREINIPCVLLETGYVTNTYDRIKMQHPQTRNAFAYAIYRGVSKYYCGD